MSELWEKNCKPCEGGVPVLTPEQVQELMVVIGDWVVSDDNTHLTRRFEFKNYYKTMAFVNAVAWIAHQEGHHPDLEVSYGSCVVNYTTHAIGGLSENDFICAAKIDRLGV